MNKCLRINVIGNFSEDFLPQFIQKNARKYNLEGSAQIIGPRDHMVVIVCGKKDDIDLFLDVLHKGTADCVPESIEIEPFLKDKDYRGVFRIIE